MSSICRVRPSQKYAFDHLTLGVCYYPEHWDESLWESDLDRMKETGIEVVRVFEFAWVLMEKEEGVFTFDLMDRFLDLCGKKDMKVIIGTPTATPPAWLTQKYPDVLNARMDGTLLRHGARRHYNYNSENYKRLSARIVEEMGKHFGKHPMIIGWQIDNELNCETDEFYSEADHKAFSKWCEKKYGSLEKLNKTWGTVFWSQCYTAWDQVSGPREVLNHGHNPSMLLDYRRFISDSCRAFCKLQADILKKYVREGVFITTNGIFNLDNHMMADESLDVYTYDSYPNFTYCLDTPYEGDDAINERSVHHKLAETRSVCRHFGIMEQQSGALGWYSRMESPAPRPGQLKLWTMQSIAQGADFISYFRWRTCNFSTEMYWHGILDYDNRDNRKLKEVKEVGEIMKKIAPVAGSDFVAAFALLSDYDNKWDQEKDLWDQRIAYKSQKEIIEAAERNHTPYDIVYINDEETSEDLSKYPVVIYPHPVLMSEKRAEILKKYAAQGGTLVVGARSGAKDMDGNFVMRPQPGLLQELTGTDVTDFTFRSPAEEDTYAIWNGEMIDTPVFNDILKPLKGTKVLASYGNSYYKGEAWLCEHSYGKGKVLHLGSSFSQSALKKIFSYLNILEPFKEYAEVSPLMSLVMREKEGKKMLFLMNFTVKEERVDLKKAGRDMLTGKMLEGEIVLKPYETIVVEF